MDLPKKDETRNTVKNAAFPVPVRFFLHKSPHRIPSGEQREHRGPAESPLRWAKTCGTLKEKGPLDTQIS